MADANLDAYLSFGAPDERAPFAGEAEDKEFKHSILLDEFSFSVGRGAESDDDSEASSEGGISAQLRSGMSGPRAGGKVKNNSGSKGEINNIEFSFTAQWAAMKLMERAAKVAMNPRAKKEDPIPTATIYIRRPIEGQQLFLKYEMKNLQIQTVKTDQSAKFTFTMSYDSMKATYFPLTKAGQRTYQAIAEWSMPVGAGE